MNQKVTVTIKSPSQNIKLNLEIPETEIDNVLNAICAQCEDFEQREEEDFDDLDFDDEGDLEFDDAGEEYY